MVSGDATAGGPRKTKRNLCGRRRLINDLRAAPTTAEPINHPSPCVRSAIALTRPAFDLPSKFWTCDALPVHLKFGKIITYNT